MLNDKREKLVEFVGTQLVEIITPENTVSKPKKQLIHIEDKDKTSHSVIPVQKPPLPAPSKNNQATLIQKSSNTPKNNPLLKDFKDPKLNIERLKNLIFSRLSFVYSDTLRLYDPYKGYFKSMDEHGWSVTLNSAIPSELRSYLNISYDLKALYQSIKYEPSIQRDTSLITNNHMYINCLNGVLNLKDMTLLPHNPNFLFFNYINANYIPNTSIENTYFQIFISTITNGDTELQNLIQEVLGYILSNYNNAKKAFFLYGQSNSGKSVFLNLITFLCGEGNISNVELQNLSDPKYTAELFGKLINICSELPDRPLTETGIFKALVSESDKVSAKKLYQQPFSFYNTAKLVFATNNLPTLKSSTYVDNTAFFNRLIIIPFLVSIPENQQDKYLLNKLINEKDCIFSWAIHGLNRYIQNGYIFTPSRLSEGLLTHYKNNENPIVQFISNCCYFSPNAFIHLDDLLRAYTQFCYEQCLDMPNSVDKKYIKSLLQEKYRLQYKRLNRKGINKYGFLGISLKGAE